MKLKTILSFIPVVALAIFFGACKKDYTCTCTYTSDSNSPSFDKQYNMTKKDAEATCDDNETVNGVSTNLDCVLVGAK